MDKYIIDALTSSSSSSSSSPPDSSSSLSSSSSTLSGGVALSLSLPLLGGFTPGEAGVDLWD